MSAKILALACALLTGAHGWADGESSDRPSGSFSGVPLAFEPCRVSAVPFNRVWEGHQRPIEQTKIAWFVNFDVTAPGVLSLEVDDGDFRIRPLSRMKDAKRTDGRIEIPVGSPGQFVVETGGTEIHVFANPPFRHVPVPGEIYFGPGVHEAGVIEPRSGQTVCIDAGATVYGSILVHHAENVKIVGRGILDCSRIARADHGSEQYKRAVAAGIAPGPYGAEMAVNAFTCYASTNVTLEGITFRDSPRWTVIVRNASKNVSIDNVKLVGMWRYNSDGVDFCASEDCRIRNSFIRTFDDCIVTRAPFLSGETTDCRNILAENCVLWCDWGKNLEIWSGSVPSTIENVVYRRCQLVNISWMACDVTTRYASPRTRIRNVTVEDLEIDVPVPPPQEHIQKTHDMKYPGGVQEKPLLLTVDCGPVGRDTGNQGIQEDVGAAKACVRYENLAFRRFRVVGDGCKTFERTVVTETPPHYRATDVTVEDVPDGCAESSRMLQGPETWLELMGGNVRKDGLRLDLEAIKAAGISGVQFFHIGDRGGPDQKGRVIWPGCEETQTPCMSEGWDDLVRFLGDECDRLGLALTVQNCPGWSQSGGPWVDLDHCQRDVEMARADLSSGEAFRLPEIPSKFRDADSDWRDVAVLAFPTPEGDAEDAFLKPSQIEKEGDNRIFRFAKPVTVRSLVLPGIDTWNSAYAYEFAWMRVALDVRTPEGWKEVVRSPLPAANWRDYVQTFTLACGEATGDAWRFRFEHDRPIRAYGEPKLSSAARTTDWESKSARTLRSLLREPPPTQDCGAWIDAAKVVDLTGRTDWKVPEGRWTVLRLGSVNCKYVNAPAPKEATGWECDKLDPSGIEACFNGYIRRLNENELKGRMRAMLVDSWECFCQTWTPKMERYFREANGYGLRPWLPALFGWIVGSPAETEKFLTDWRRTNGDLITKNYYGRMAELARGAGLEAYYETAFGDIIHGDLLEYWKYSDAPMCEYWYPHSHAAAGGCGSYSFKPIRPCASAAHIYGKCRVVAEAFTGMGIRWDEDFCNLQDDANRHFARGVTHLAFQSYTHAPVPDAVPPGGCMGGYNGTPFTRLQTWWSLMPEFTGWLTRCEELLEAGRPTQDVLWYLGDAVDHKPDEMYPFPEGFRADYLNHDVLTNRLSVMDGLFTIPEGARWKVLWVPDELYMLSATRAALDRLAAAGGTVVYGGKDALARALSGLQKDVATEPALGDEPSEDFMWIHRTAGGIERYFVAAGTNGYCGKVTFRAKGTATVYDPVSQTRQEWTNGTVLEIPPSRSVFVEFGGAKGEVRRAKCEGRSAKGEGRKLEIAGWTLAFAKGWGAPETVTLETPVSWTEIPGFSREAQAYAGTVVYTASFDLSSLVPRPSFLVLDLGKVKSTARVFVNGQEVRTLWCEPYRCDLSQYVREGRNELRIEVTNTWRNRIIYDLGQPERDRKTWILYKEGYNPRPTDAFGPAGILGSVVLEVEK